MKKYKFILNRRSGVLHKFPANEADNVDAIPRLSRFHFVNYNLAKSNEEFRRLCRRCF